MTAFLDRLVWASLTINLAKCEFARATVAYLEKVVGQGEVWHVWAKVTAIEAYPAPSTRAELMRFQRLAGYYCGFCANFSSVAAPLTNLLKARAKYNWSPECQAAFEKVKKQLSKKFKHYQLHYSVVFFTFTLGQVLRWWCTLPTIH